MRRTVIFVTLASLLIAVAGVTAAQNGVVDLRQETTTPEPLPQATVETPGPTSEDTPDRFEGTVIEPGGGDAGRGDEANHRGDTPGPEAGGDRAGPEEGPGGGKTAKDGHDEESGGEKVTVCHGGKTLSVGAPAEPAHLEHGDTPGPC